MFARNSRETKKNQVKEQGDEEEINL